MKKMILLFALCGLSSLSMTAQDDDDLYFTPKKSAGAKAFDDNTPAYYVGSNRSVDEYNRRGKLPDSTYVDSDFASSIARRGSQDYDVDNDYNYTRRMNRWDDYYGPWYADWHSPLWYSRYGFYDPWDPWYWDYAGWYSPWYSGWHSPWYYGGYWGGYWGWHGHYDPWFRPGWGGVAVVPGGTGRTIAGTRNHGFVNGRNNGNAGSTHFGSRNNSTASSTSTSQSPARFGSRSYSNSTPSRSYQNSGNTSFSTPSSSFGGSRSIGSGSSFGGSRSGGGFSGGGHSSGGGGHFGGRR